MRLTEDALPLGFEVFLRFKDHIDVQDLPEVVFEVTKKPTAPLFWHCLRNGPWDCIPLIWKEMERRDTIRGVLLAFDAVKGMQANRCHYTGESLTWWEWAAPRMVELVGEELLSMEVHSAVDVLEDTAMSDNVTLLRAMSDKYGKDIFRGRQRPILSSAMRSTGVNVVRMLMDDCPEVLEEIELTNSYLGPDCLLEILPFAPEEAWQRPDASGDTIAHRMAAWPNEKAIEVLSWLACHCDSSWLALRNVSSGRTALHVTFRACPLEKARIIVEAMECGDLLLCDNDGNSALHLLLLWSHSRWNPLSEQLLTSFLELLPREVLTLRDNNGRTPSELAAEFGQQGFAALLEPMVKGAM